MSKAKKAVQEEDEPEIEENPNRIEIEGAVARTVNEAINILKYFYKF